MKKGNSIYQFLQKALEDLRPGANAKKLFKAVIYEWA
jgi:hypothetical protein